MMRFLIVLAVLGAAIWFWERPAGARGREERIEAALARAERVLLSAQQADGGFKSETYGVFKDEISLTPHVLCALQRLPASERVMAARKKAVAYLVKELSELSEKKPLAYPVYTLSAAICALVNENVERAVIEKLVARLRDYQFTDEGGWTYLIQGGWGYNKVPMKKGEEGSYVPDPNLSATVYALKALRAAGVSVNDKAVKSGLRFVGNCHNHTALLRPEEDWGGFFFSPVVVERNKAGEREDMKGRYRAYGAMTADGIRALVYAGGWDDAIAAGARWMRKYFSAEEQPGAFPEIKKQYQKGMYFYYLASVAEAAAMRPDCVPADWRAKMSEAILRRQNGDGSWTNRFTDGREDDPLVGTMHAVVAISYCRM